MGCPVLDNLQDTPHWNRSAEGRPRGWDHRPRHLGKLALRRRLAVNGVHNLVHQSALSWTPRPDIIAGASATPSFPRVPKSQMRSLGTFVIDSEICLGHEPADAQCVTAYIHSLQSNESRHMQRYLTVQYVFRWGSLSRGILPVLGTSVKNSGGSPAPSHFGTLSS
ncbi:hypothetical protein CONLIGDRAFT_194246 [Coniochaeta ligniaria NRRL 30616]|uniref:Uncharacterized protein n=1 Tax=Coniochaeta ligniaria NRRL 30616 TaxID=1408157 RepID=A0A1J7K104_9PEZI|nr:hypothetical protein CONLIGDRAFT_194246 [Coniochaeta ligniaria NRRL 30616]